MDLNRHIKELVQTAKHLLAALHQCCRHCGGGGTKAHFNYAVAVMAKAGKTTMFEVTLTTAERVKITVNPYPAGSRLDGPVIATPEDGATFGAKVEQVDDNTIILDAGNVAGDVIYDLKADVDLGPGVETITEQVVLHCNNPKAQQLGLAIGEILPKGTSSTVSPVPTQPYTGLADASTKPAPVEPK